VFHPLKFDQVSFIPLPKEETCRK